MSTVPSSETVAVSSFAVGLSSTAPTVITTVAVSGLPSTSVIVYVNESVPLKSAFGVYTNTPVRCLCYCTVRWTRS